MGNRLRLSRYAPSRTKCSRRTIHQRFICVILVFIIGMAMMLYYQDSISSMDIVASTINSRKMIRIDDPKLSTTTTTRVLSPSTKLLLTTINPGKIADKSRKGREMCPSQFRVGYNFEHSPLIFSLSKQSPSAKEGNNNIDITNKSTVTDIVVCRAPKVGSTMLRFIHTAYNANLTFDRVYNPDKWNIPYELGFKNMTHERFQYLTTNNNNNNQNSVQRIMFVRHPVLRIISGFLQIHYHDTPNDFKHFVFNKKNGLLNHYRPHCDDDIEFDISDKRQYEHPALDMLDKVIQRNGEKRNSIRHNLKMSQHEEYQHWAPAQHCRCGISDCNIQYQYYHIERIPSIQHVMRKYLILKGDGVIDDGISGSNSSCIKNNNDTSDDTIILSTNCYDKTEDPIWMPPLETKSNARENTNELYAAYLLRTIQGTITTKKNGTAIDQFPMATSNSRMTVLDFLNELTKPEQEYFGYLPLKKEHILSGTVGLIYDS